MIASVRELGIGVRPRRHPGAAAAAPPSRATTRRRCSGCDDPVIELNVTPDRGYCFSVRGLARELAAATDADFADPARRVAVPDGRGEGWPVPLDDAGVRAVRRPPRRRGRPDGAPSPWWMQRRLLAAGMRPISLIVDVTNYVMLELGQPLHAYDAARLPRPDRRAPGAAGRDAHHPRRRRAHARPRRPADHRRLRPDRAAGVMGGASTEIPAGGTDPIDVLIEAAHFDPATIARGARRHKLPSEASRRFERTVDPQLPPVAAERAAAAARRARRRHDRRRSHRRRRRPAARPPVRMALDLPDRVAGVAYPPGRTVRAAEPGRLRGRARHRRRRPRPGARHAAVVAARPHHAGRPRRGGAAAGGLRHDPVRAARGAAPGRGLTAGQLRRRAVSPGAGRGRLRRGAAVPVRRPGGVGRVRAAPPTTPRRHTVRVLNPLDADRAELATTLLPGPARHAGPQPVARGSPISPSTRSGRSCCRTASTAPDAGPGGRRAARRTPRSPRSWPRCRPSPCTSAWCWPATASRAAGGDPGVPARWADAVAAARSSGRPPGSSCGSPRPTLAPWHPGRCAALRVGDFPVGHAGELHPKVVEALGLPPRTCAMEIDLDLLPLDDARPVPRVSPYPPVAVDVALVATAAVPAAELDRRAAGRRRRAAGGRAPVRRLHRRAGGGGQAVAGLHAALPRRRTAR